MYKYGKYIILRLIGSVLLISGSLTGIIWLTQSLRFIELIINQGIGFLTFLYISSLLIPSLLWVVLPVSIFISVIYVYNKMIVDSELVAIENSGISRVRVAVPVFVLGIISTLFSYFLSLYLMPVSYREFKDMQSFVRDNYASLMLQEGVFNNPMKGLTIYIRERTGDGMLKGMLVHDNRNADKPITMMAAQGRLVQTETGPKFTLLKGNRQEINYKQKQVYILNFDSYSIDISAFEKSVENRWREPEERFLPELFYPENTQANLIPKLISHGHYRIAWPLYSMVMAVFAVAIVLPSQFNRRKRWTGVVFGSLIAVGLIANAIMLNNLVAKNLVLIPTIYANLFLGFTISIILLFKKNKLGKK